MKRALTNIVIAILAFSLFGCSAAQLWEMTRHGFSQWTS